MVTVTVTDTQAPTLTCPAEQTVTATSSTGAVVNFSPTATDHCATIMTSCTPASGSTFPLGVTPVTCTATDGVGLQNSCSFDVHVVPPLVTTVPFTKVKAALKVEHGRLPGAGELEYQMAFTLGAGNDGIAPLTEHDRAGRCFDVLHSKRIVPIELQREIHFRWGAERRLRQGFDLTGA